MDGEFADTRFSAMRPRAIFLGEEFWRVLRADQQGGEPIRRRRILWETAQAWNGGVAE